MGALSACTPPCPLCSSGSNSTCLEGSHLRCNTRPARLFLSRPRSATALHCDSLSLNSWVRCSRVVRSYVSGDGSRTILSKGYPSKAHSGPRCLIRLCESRRRKSKRGRRSYFPLAGIRNFLDRLYIVWTASDIHADRGNLRETSSKLGKARGGSSLTPP